MLGWVPTGVQQDQSMDIDAAPATVPPLKTPSTDPVPEVEVYLRLLILHHLLKTPSNYPRAKELAQETVATIHRLNRRSMDPIAAKVWYAVERTYELSGELSEARSYARSINRHV